MRFNGEMLTLAREFFGLTQQELAVRIGASQPTIAKIEAGLRDDVDDGLAEKIASALNFPASFFQQNEALLSFGSSSYFYRKRATLLASDRKRIHSLVNLLRIALRQMLKHVDIEPKRELPKLDLEDYGGSPSRAAQALRGLWHLPDGPIRSLTELVEGAGVVVFRCRFDTRKFDGTSLRISDMPPLVFLNEDLPGDRWRYTLSHELAHLVLHTVPHEAMEDEADEFAAEFLTPEEDVRPQLRQVRRWRAAELSQLKLYWRVSMHMLVYRASQLGVLSADQARAAFISLAPMRQLEPAPIPQENTATLRKIVAAITDDLDFKEEGLQSLLHWPADLTRRLLPYDAQEPARLRLV